MGPEVNAIGFNPTNSAASSEVGATKRQNLMFVGTGGALRFVVNGGTGVVDVGPADVFVAALVRALG
jgi:3-methyladenine DNA glycosylase Mpg